MRYGFGYHHAHHWMAMGWIMPLLWLIFLGVVVWAAFRFLRKTSFATPQPGPGFDGRETPEELLDRRFASGEIDADAHAAARKHLQDHPR